MFQYIRVTPALFWSVWWDAEEDEFITVSNGAAGVLLSVRREEVAMVAVGDGFGVILTRGGDEITFDSMPRRVEVEQVDNVVYLNMGEEE